MIADPRLLPLSFSLPSDVRLVDDSRHIQAGDWFIAAGSRRMDHVHDAVTRGAAAIVADDGLESFDSPVQRIPVSDSNALAAIVDRSHYSLAPFPLVGVTGTDGKSTVTWFTWQALGAGAGRMGTLGWHDGAVERASTHTTPPAQQIHAFLAHLPTSTPGVVCEISSHAIDQRRMDGLELDALVITTIGRDHLDYHRTQAHYCATKLATMRLVRPGGVVVVPADEPYSHTLVHAARSYGLVALTLGWDAGEYRLGGANGVWTLFGENVDLVLRLPMPGQHNAWNAAAAILLARSVGVDPELAHQRIAGGASVPGRLERVAEQPLVYIDYAHTPQAIELTIAALRDAYPNRKIICVVGCGGDRDPGKRPLMARAALAADQVVFTSDNPRSEDPQAIIDQMLSGVDRSVLVEIDRGQAIARALTCAGSGGVVVICGKGHERVQVIGDESRPWHDGDVVRAALAQRGVA